MPIRKKNCETYFQNLDFEIYLKLFIKNFWRFKKKIQLIFSLCSISSSSSSGAI